MTDLEQGIAGHVVVQHEWDDLVAFLISYDNALYNGQAHRFAVHRPTVAHDDLLYATDRDILCRTAAAENGMSFMVTIQRPAVPIDEWELSNDKAEVLSLHALLPDQTSGIAWFLEHMNCMSQSSSKSLILSRHGRLFVLPPGMA